jgi:hypothetical protein
MDRILKVIDYIIYIMVVCAIIGFFVGTYQAINLLFIRG